MSLIPSGAPHTEGFRPSEVQASSHRSLVGLFGGLGVGLRASGLGAREFKFRVWAWAFVCCGGFPSIEGLQGLELQGLGLRALR